MLSIGLLLYVGGIEMVVLSVCLWASLRWHFWCVSKSCPNISKDLPRTWFMWLFQADQLLIMEERYINWHRVPPNDIPACYSGQIRFYVTHSLLQKEMKWNPSSLPVRTNQVVRFQFQCHWTPLVNDIFSDLLLYTLNFEVTRYIYIRMSTITWVVKHSVNILSSRHFKSITKWMYKSVSR